MLGEDLPLIHDGVTLEHLLAHRSGIGDYLDEDADYEITDYMTPVAVNEIATTDEYLAVLGGYETAFAPDARFAYNNSGFVVLGVIAERASGVPFHDLVRAARLRAGGDERHRVPALRRAPGASRARIPRRRAPQDERAPPAGARHRDGGIYSTAADVGALWSAFFAGRIVSTRLGGRDGPAAQRRAQGGATLRPRVLAPPRRATS